MKTQSKLQLLHQIFDAVADLPPGDDRTEMIRDLSGDDPELQAEVEDLLEKSNEEDGFMSNPEVSPDDVEFLLTSDLKEGTMIGKYRLLEHIGEGANAMVYMVEQFEPFRRRAALKVIKAGMDTREVIARFESERQALAMMEHPNIAKVFDAGATAAGRPYFVMELVKGIAITEYCDLNRLGTRERLELFISVCHAIAHAHLKGIIHRDIKPSNILVTLHDGEPVPKVIDFGIAKATGPNLTERTLFTRFHQFIGTPAYMSPEQAEMSGLDVDTRCDVYSLGVLLYELLTGSTPFCGREMLESGLSELQRVIRDSDPETPSTRINTMSAEGLTAVAKSRRIKPGELSADIKGDLDWIVMKALEKDRVRRYDTVGELMRDVRRHLDNEPVEAGPPSRVYRLKKFIQRNRTMAVAVVLVTVSLIAALLIASFGLIQARKDAEVARREAEKSDTVIGLMDEMFHSASPDSEKGKDFTVSQLLDDFSGRVVEQLSSEPEVELTLRRTVGLAYDGLGESLQAEPHLRRALELAHQIHGPASTESAELLARLGWLTHELSNDQDAIKKLQEAADIQLEYLGANHPDYLRSLSYLAAIYRKSGQPEQARKLAEEVLAKAEEQTFPDLSWVRQILAMTYRDLGEDEKAELLAARIVEEVQDGTARQRPRNLGALQGVVQGQIKDGKLKEAGELIELGLNAAERTLEPNHRITLLLRGSKADLARARGDGETALRIYRDLHEAQKQSLGPDHADTINTLVKIASTGLEQNQIELAGNAARDALNAATRGHGDDHELTFQSVFELADSLVRKGKYQAAESLLRSNYRMALTSLEPDSDIVLNFMRRLARVYQLLDRNSTAELYQREALGRSRNRFGPDAPQTLLATEELCKMLESTSRLGEAQELSGNLVRMRGSWEDLQRHADLLRLRRLATPAIKHYEQALAMVADDPGSNSAAALQLRFGLAESHSYLKHYDQSRKLLEDGLEAARMHLGKDDRLTQRFQSALNSLNKMESLGQSRIRNAKASYQRNLDRLGASSEATMTSWKEWIKQLNQTDPELAGRELPTLLKLCRETLGEKHRLTFQVRREEADHTAVLGREEEAELLYRQLIADAVRNFPPDDREPRILFDHFSVFMLHRDRRAEFNEVADAWQDGLTEATWDPESAEILLPRGSDWLFLNYEADEGTNWKEFGEEAPPTDSQFSWQRGLAPFGYGIIGQATSPLLTPGRYSHTTFYFRKAFEVEEPEGFEQLKIRLLREDGAAVYLNGQEVVRDKLAPNARFNTPASDDSWQYERSTCQTYLADASLLRPGLNIIAVEVHQSSSDSRDMAFDLELSGRRRDPTQ